MKNILNVVKVSSLVFTASILMMASSHADTFGVSISGTGTGPNGGGTGLIGMSFQVNQDIDLTQLGFYASSINGPGGDTPHVALIDITSGQGNPPTVLFDTGNLADATVNPAGLVNNTINYINVGTPIELFTGKTYEIAAPVYFAESFPDTSSFTPGSAITNVTYLQGTSWGGWDATNTTYSYTAQVAQTGPIFISDNFQYTTIPEPSTYAMLGLGSLGLFFFVRRKRAQLA